jgi:DNA-binding NarL/FixJ family response regulator
MSSEQEKAQDEKVAHPRKVLIVDDHPIVCAGLKQIIDHEEDLTVCGTADDVNGALQAIRRLSPDVAIVDLNLRREDGLQLIKAASILEKAPVQLVLSMLEERIYVERAFRAGAQGYLTKLEAGDQVIVALRTILAGGTYISKRLRSYDLNPNNIRPTRTDPVDDLSDRELQVFRLIGEGYGTRRIAEVLGLSIKTVESHRRNIKQKLGLTSANELVRQAALWHEREGAAGSGGEPEDGDGGGVEDSEDEPAR